MNLDVYIFYLFFLLLFVELVCSDVERCISFRDFIKCTRMVCNVINVHVVLLNILMLAHQ